MRMMPSIIKPPGRARMTGKISEMRPEARRTTKKTMPWAAERYGVANSSGDHTE